jgi:tRNA(Arg) A34 adenosine deaminase TadA
MNLLPYDIGFMRLAIAASREAAELGNTPFGALLARGERQLMIGGNEERTSSDFAAHAELALLRKAQHRLGLPAIAGTTLYASGEPCAMCAGAIFWAGISRVVYAATKDDIALALGDPNLPVRCSDSLAGCSPSVSVEGPLLREEAAAILRRFGKR